VPREHSAATSAHRDVAVGADPIEGPAKCHASSLCSGLHGRASTGDIDQSSSRASAPRVDFRPLAHVVHLEEHLLAEHSFERVARLLKACVRSVVHVLPLWSLPHRSPRFKSIHLLQGRSEGFLPLEREPGIGVEGVQELVGRSPHSFELLDAL